MMNLFPVTGKKQQSREAQVQKNLGDDRFHVVFDNGKNRTHDCQEIINMAN